MLKLKLLLVLAACLPFYSYSDGLKPYYGYTGNAAADNALRWSMRNVLPTPPGLDIQNVIYSYRIRKETADLVSVDVQNANASGTGFIFKSTDDWKPGSLSGTQINKVVGVGSVPRQLWGDGSIEVRGPGSVYETNVVYTYKVNPCYDPQFNPGCPGYKPQMPNISEFDVSTIYDGTKDARQDNITIEQDKENLENNEEDKEEALEEIKRKYRLEKAMSVIDKNALVAESSRLDLIAASASAAFERQGYYSAVIPGGVYKDSVILVDKKLPDARAGLRNGLAQQLLHQKMVDMQFNLNENKND